MSTATRSGAFVAALLSTLSGCAHESRARTPDAVAADEARGAGDRAARAERDLAQARERSEAARREAQAAEQRHAQARQQLGEAERNVARTRERAEQERAGVERLAATARQRRQQAIDAAVRAQVAAEEAQGLRAATGRVAEASASRVILQLDDGRTMSFQVDQKTKVIVGTEQRSIADIQQGADARVAYDPRLAEAPAITIHVTPARVLPREEPQPAQR